MWKGGRVESFHKDRHSVILKTVNPMYTHKNQDESQYGMDNPRIAVHKKQLETSPKYCSLVQVEIR